MTVGGRGRGCGERGQAGGIEVLPFGLLVFITGALLIANLWGVIDSKFSTDSAAREAARYVVEAARDGVDPSVLQAGAAEIARQAMTDHGRHGPISVSVMPDGPFERCTRITVRVSTAVPAIRVPFVGGFGDAFDVVAQHSELVDPTRSGVGGRASCLR